MAIRIQIRRDTAANWLANNPILQSGEIGYDFTNKKFKVGIANDATSRWNVLPYLNITPAELLELVQDYLNDTISNGNGISKSYNDVTGVYSISVDTSVIADKSYVDTAVSGLSNTVTSGYIPLSLMGTVDGVAELDSNGYVPDNQLNPSITRDSELTAAITQEVTDRNTAISTAIGNLIDSAPTTLDTLNELAQAINDDASYAATITTALGTKLETSTATATYVPKTEASIDYYITNAGMGAYMVNGISNGTLHFEKGKRYRIVVNASGHPFWIQSVSGAYSSANVYSAGITNNGTDNGSILVELDQLAPEPSLFYACQYHPSMAGTIFVGNRAATAKAIADLSNVNNTSDINKPISTATQTALDLKSDEKISYISESGTSRTLSASDLYKVIHTSSGSNITITIPNDVGDVLFPVGSYLEIRQMGAGQVTVSVTSPATAVASDNGFKTRVQYSSIIVEKHATNSWYVTGDTTA